MPIKLAQPFPAPELRTKILFKFIDRRIFLNLAMFIDLLMGLFREAVFDHGGVPENCPLVLMGRFPSLMGRLPSLMGRFPECLNGPFSLLKIHWKTAH